MLPWQMMPAVKRRRSMMRWVQAWKEKQAAAAALNEKLQAAQSCDWENGYEFDEHWNNLTNVFKFKQI